MKFWDVMLSLLIILLFVGMYVFSIFSVGLKTIHKKWPEYRCNPIMMPFASQFGPEGTDTTQNFTSCVQNELKGMFSTLMEPIHYAISLANKAGGGIMDMVNDIRKVIDFVKNMVSSITKQIIGVFMNVIIEILRLIIKMKDLGSKIMGTMAITLFMVDGMVKTGQGIWAGPVGDVMRFLCFHPHTPILLKNSKYKRMCDISIGDILENGSKVVGTLELQGSEENPYYRIYSEKLGKNIFVTGSHLVQSPSTGEFIHVSELEKSIPGRYYTENMSCLITDNHRIPIGEYVFWDWEDEQLI